MKRSQFDRNPRFAPNAARSMDKQVSLPGLFKRCMSLWKGYKWRRNSRGYFWGDRFKSVIVDKGETLVNCLTYIDLNPLRAGLVERPEDYRWNSLGYHLQAENKDQFPFPDFGLKEFNVKSPNRYKI